ncbi:MAG: hypothetical protein KDD64_11960 [Bdellovibrionales bacterium]|nr:hypothetical protein [Bdellovibrionales bacterium]
MSQALRPDATSHLLRLTEPQASLPESPSLTELPFERISCGEDGVTLLGRPLGDGDVIEVRWPNGEVSPHEVLGVPSVSSFIEGQKVSWQLSLQANFNGHPVQIPLNCALEARWFA